MQYNQLLPAPADLYYFLEVAATLNISRAAERLGLSQPSLSLAIKRLEDNLGLALLVRGKSGVRLTKAGDRMRRESSMLLEAWEKVRGEALRDESEVRGQFTIGCHPSVAMYSLPGALPSLLKHYPGLDLKLVHDLSRRITEDVISFKVDLGIVVNPAPHPDLVIKSLSTDDVSLWTRANPTSLQDVSSGGAVLTFDPDLLQSQAVIQQLAKRSYQFARYLPSSNLDVIASLVGAGIAVGILPSRVATRIKAFKLERLAKDAPKVLDTICLIYRADTLRSKAGREIARTIVESFAEGR